MEKLENYQSVVRWLSGVSGRRTGSHKTRVAYLERLKKFCKWVKENPDEMIERRKQQMTSADPSQKNYYEDQLVAYFDYLEKTLKLSRNSAAAEHGAIRSFFRYNRLQLSVETPKKWRAGKSKKPISAQEIAALAGILSPRDRAIVLLLKDSGMAPEDVAGMDYGEIGDELVGGGNVWCWEHRREKEKIWHHAMAGPEATDAVKTYLKIRAARGEKFSDDTPLFVVREAGRTKLKTAGIANAVGAAAKSLGYAHFTPYQLRRFFTTQMKLRLKQLGGELLVEYWAGHAVDPEKIAYFVATAEEQKAKYMSAYYDALAVFRKEGGGTPKEAALEAMRSVARSLGLDPTTIRIARFKDEEPTPEQETDAIAEEIGNIRKGVYSAGAGYEQPPLVEHRVAQTEDEYIKMLADGWSLDATVFGKPAMRRAK